MTMSTATDTSTWKNKGVSKGSDMSRAGNRADKGGDRVDPRGRGGWWLGTLKDTPVPGLYHVRDFIEEAELNPVRKTYGFKGVGRRGPAVGGRTGAVLLPGAYRHRDCIQELLTRPASYSFKNCPRPDAVTLGVRDKHINTSPCDYDVTAKPVEKIPCKHVMFRSTVQRLSFPPKTPGPGAYEPPWKLGDRLHPEAIDPSFSLFFRNIV